MALALSEQVPTISPVQQERIYTALITPYDTENMRQVLNNKYGNLYYRYVNDYLVHNTENPIDTDKIEDLKQLIAQTQIVVDDSTISLKPHLGNIIGILTNMPPQLYDPVTQRVVVSLKEFQDETPQIIKDLQKMALTAGSYVGATAATVASIKKASQYADAIKQGVQSCVQYATTTTARSEILGATPTQYMMRSLGSTPIAQRVRTLTSNYSMLAGLVFTLFTTTVTSGMVYQSRLEASEKTSSFVEEVECPTGKVMIHPPVSSAQNVDVSWLLGRDNPSNQDVQHLFPTLREKFQNYPLAGNTTRVGDVLITKTIKFRDLYNLEGIYQDTATKYPSGNWITGTVARSLKGFIQTKLDGLTLSENDNFILKTIKDGKAVQMTVQYSALSPEKTEGFRIVYDISAMQRLAKGKNASKSGAPAKGGLTAEAVIATSKKTAKLDLEESMRKAGMSELEKQQIRKSASGISEPKPTKRVLTEVEKEELARQKQFRKESLEQIKDLSKQSQEIIKEMKKKMSEEERRHLKENNVFISARIRAIKNSISAVDASILGMSTGRGRGGAMTQIKRMQQLVDEQVALIHRAEVDAKDEIAYMEKLDRTRNLLRHPRMELAEEIDKFVREVRQLPRAQQTPAIKEIIRKLEFSKKRTLEDMKDEDVFTENVDSMLKDMDKFMKDIQSSDQSMNEQQINKSLENEFVNIGGNIRSGKSTAHNMKRVYGLLNSYAMLQFSKNRKWEGYKQSERVKHSFTPFDRYAKIYNSNSDSFAYGV